MSLFKSQKSGLYLSFCGILTVVYFSSIAYNIILKEPDIFEMEAVQEEALAAHSGMFFERFVSLWKTSADNMIL